MTRRQRRHVEAFDQSLDPPREPAVYLLVTEATARELAAGRVPPEVLSQAAAAVDACEGKF